MFVSDLRMIYKSVLFGSYNFDEAVSETQSCASHKMEASLPAWAVIVISPGLGCVVDVLKCRFTY